MKCRAAAGRSGVTTLLLGKEPREALRAFERVLQLTLDNPISEQNVGLAWNAAGQSDKAAAHLERCLELDPLLLPAAATLMNVYHQQGDAAKESALAERIRQAMKVTPRPAR
jgi:Tfp pilus assembly protein PilF